MNGKLIVLGSSAEFPLPRTVSNKFEDYLSIEKYQKKFRLHDDELCNSAKRGGKDRRTRACLALSINKKTILFDAGPDIKHQLRKHRLRPDAVFLSHEHPDANYGLRYLDKVKVFSEKLGNLKPGKKTELFGAEIISFRVVHSKIAPLLGYRVFLKSGRRNKSFVYITDLASLRGLENYIRNCDILFADGSILKRNLGGHLSMVNQLKIYKRWKPKRVIFTHIGHATLKHNDLVKFVKGRYKNSDVAYDGMTIGL